MGSFRVLLFYILVLAAAVLMLVSWFMPWWNAYIVVLGESVVFIHPWGLETNIPQHYASYLTGADMSVWFAPLMWIYLGLCIAALLFSLFVSEKRVGLSRFKFLLPKFIIGLVGLSYIVTVATAVLVIAGRAGDFYGATLIGSIHLSVGSQGSLVTTGLLFGYWLACAVGPLLIVLALFRNKIMGKT